MSETTVAVQTFVNGCNRDNYEACMKWIQEQQLCRDQIVSITAAEEQIEEGDQTLFLVYRTKSTKEGSLPANVVYFEFDYSLDWDSLLTQGRSVISKNGNVEVLGFSRTAKNFGQSNSQVMWFIRDGAYHFAPQLHEIRRTDGNLAMLAEDVN
jgi:hypothetical protein